jgi:hypothetical protein
MILLTKEEMIYHVDCHGSRTKILFKDAHLYLDVVVKLDDSFTLKNFFNIIEKINDFYFLGNVPETSIDCLEQEFEYVSVTPLYNLNIKNNGVHIIDKSHNLLQLETSEGPLYVFDYMLSDQVLNLEFRIERDVIEYNDATFFMPEELTVRELFDAVRFGIIDSGVD